MFVLNHRLFGAKPMEHIFGLLGFGRMGYTQFVTEESLYLPGYIQFFLLHEKWRHVQALLQVKRSENTNIILLPFQ